MPVTPHVEKHFTATETVRDIVIGMADGLTVPFALAAGLSSLAVSTTAIVITGGLAEIAAGSIAMGLGGYLAARTDAEHYASELKREFDETENVPEKEADEVAEAFRGFGLTDQQLAPLVTAISTDKAKWVDFMMRFELGLEQPKPARARQSAFTIAVSYIVGGLIPLFPYMVIRSITPALYASVAATLVALFIFGLVKGRFTGLKPLRSGLQTVLVGGLAAGAAFLIAHTISPH